MTKTELRYIAEDLVDELREMPDLSETTSWQLLKVGDTTRMNLTSLI